MTPDVPDVGHTSGTRGSEEDRARSAEAEGGTQTQAARTSPDRYVVGLRGRIEFHLPVTTPGWQVDAMYPTGILGCSGVWDLVLVMGSPLP